MTKSIVKIPLVLMALVLFNCADEGFTPTDDNTTSASNPETSTSSHVQFEVPYSYEASSNGTVRFTFENTTGHEMNGDVIREGVSYQQNGTIITEFSVPGGNTFSYIDDNVLPGETYRYIFEYITEGMTEYIINFDTVTAVSDIPALGNFLLLAPPNNDEYEVLTNGYTIEIGNTNIRVEANETHTRSVVFYLDGKQLHDSNAPFTLFRDEGQLQNGDHTLSAIAYPKKNGKGIPGDTATVNFKVNNIY